MERGFVADASVWGNLDLGVRSRLAVVPLEEEDKPTSSADSNQLCCV